MTIEKPRTQSLTKRYGRKGCTDVAKANKKLATYQTKPLPRNYMQHFACSQLEQEENNKVIGSVSRGDDKKSSTRDVPSKIVHMKLQATRRTTDMAKGTGRSLRRRGEQPRLQGVKQNLEHRITGQRKPRSAAHSQNSRRQPINTNQTQPLPPNYRQHTTQTHNTNTQHKHTA